MNYPLRLSHSSLSTLNSCERKFQIEKLLVNDGKEESEHLSFGHSFGTGVAEYFATGDADKALLMAWLAYWPEIETEKKSWPICFAALTNAFMEIDNLRQDYDVVYYNGKPAAELSFRMDINPEYYFVGHIDLVLFNKWTKRFCIFEVKTTGLQLLDLAPLYMNSGQALGYSIALDKIVGEEQSSYDVLYFVAQMKKDFHSVIHVLPFSKTLLDRLNWFLALGMDVKRLEMMAELNSYPKRGDACLRFNRPCRHFSTCHLSSFDVPAEREPDTTEYAFHYDLNSLITDHIARIQANPSLTLLGESK